MEPLSDGPGEQANPVVLAVPGGTHAMGIFAPRQAGAHTSGPTYGRHRFDAAKVVKWNCVFRADRRATAGEYPYQMFVVVGDLTMVRDALAALHHTAP